MRDLENNIVGAEAVFQTLKETVSKQPVDNEFCLQQVQTCVTAVIALTDLEGADNKWQAVYNDQTYYSNLWTGPVAPNPDGDGLVFNYMYVLPLYLRSIYMLLATVGTLLPKDLVNYSSILNNCITRLQRVHDTVVGGIVAVRKPVAADLWMAYKNVYPYNVGPPGPYVSSAPDGKYLAYGNWSGGVDATADPNQVFGTAWPFQLYGAVDIYSGTNSVQSYQPLDVPPFGPPPDENWTDAVLGKLQLRILKGTKEVYEVTGMPAVFTAANMLRKIIGQPQLPQPSLDHWSLREIYNVLGTQARFGSGWSQPQPVRIIYPSPTLKQLRSFLQTAPPTKTGTDASHLTPYAPTSVRAMLQA